jgi:hypothetical protein
MTDQDNGKATTVYSGPLCQDTKRGIAKSYFLLCNFCVLFLNNLLLLKIHLSRGVVIQGLMEPFVIVKREIAS